MPLRRRRPVLRAAVAGGAAYHMGKRAAARSEAAAPEPAQAPAPAQSPGMSPAAVQSLKELADLHERGVLTDAEFEQQKQVYLAQE